MKFIKTHLPLLAVAGLAALMLLPFLGLADFNTKGEPREAVVAMSMFKEGDWILPVNNGVDIPYKPPFFHYCIAALSLLGGSVSEYTSRLPSALALVGLAAGCFAFYRRRTSAAVALSGTLLLLTAFEVHRAGVNCRVDMVLTAFTVGSMLLFYRWWERGSHGVPLLAVLCMSGAVLTKGPVGFAVPCLVMGVFTLLRGGGFWRTLLSYTGLAMLSCVLPAVWYLAAWHEGGQQFLDLVYEENIGRMTGTMSYESHTHPFTYNFFTLFTGWAPWTLLLIVSLFAKPWKRTATDTGKPRQAASDSTATGQTMTGSTVGRLTRMRVRIMQITPVRLFTWLGFLLVLLFYSLPASKRSVYLLPCYPFMAMLIAQYVEWLWTTRRRRTLRAYTVIMLTLSVALTAVFVAVRMGAVPDTMFHGKHAAENIAMLHALRDTPLNVWTLALVALPVVNAVIVARDLTGAKTKGSMRIALYDLFAPVVLLFMAIDGFYQPVALNTKSLRPMAERIAQTFHGQPVYQHVEDPMMHFFGADFYLDDSMAQFETPAVKPDGRRDATRKITPQHGVLVVPEGDFAALAKRHPDYQFSLVGTADRGAAEMKDRISFYRFERKAK